MSRETRIITGFLAVALLSAYLLLASPGILGPQGTPITTAVLITAPTPATGGTGTNMTARVRLRDGTTVEASVPVHCDARIGQTVRLLIVPPERAQQQPQYQVLGVEGSGI